MTEKRTLSSDWSFFYKFVFPSVWLSGFGAGTIALFLEAAASHAPGYRGPPPEMKWAFLLGWLMGFVMIYFGGIRLKKVSLVGEDLVVSNYIRTTTIPLRKIESVAGTRMFSPEHLRITAALSLETRYSFIFMPPLRFHFGFSEHPMAQEIRAMVAKARSEMTAEDGA